MKYVSCYNVNLRISGTKVTYSHFGQHCGAYSRGAFFSSLKTCSQAEILVRGRGGGGAYFNFLLTTEF